VFNEQTVVDYYSFMVHFKDHFVSENNSILDRPNQAFVGSIIDHFFQGFEAAPLVRQIECLVDMWEWGIVAAHPLDWSFKM